MESIGFEQIVYAVENMCIEMNYELGADVLESLRGAYECESDARAKRILGQLLENAEIAGRDRIPLCQDTGLAIVFVEQGSEVTVRCPAGKTVTDAINEGVERGYGKGLLRKSVVVEPLGDRVNSGTNRPAIVHYEMVAGSGMRISIMAKGGGCENKSKFCMFKPTADRSEIIDWVVDVVESAGADACPPFVVGVGIGGNFEYSCYLAKKSLLRRMGESNSSEYYAEMEAELLSRINATGVGPQGLGGDTTAIGCMIETAPCHIASLPVAVNIECHSHRHRSVELG